MRYFKFKFLVTITLLVFCISCAGPIRQISFQTSPGADIKLKQIKTICFGQITCQDTIIAKAIRNAIIQELLGSDIKLNSNTESDVKIDLTITTTSDLAMGGMSTASRSYGVSSFSGSAGEYISGITAQIIKDGEILTSVTVTQLRTASGLPESPIDLSFKLARNLLCLLQEKSNKCSSSNIEASSWHPTFSFMPGIGFAKNLSAFSFSGSFGVVNPSIGLVSLNYDGIFETLAHSVSLGYSFPVPISQSFNIGPVLGVGYSSIYWTNSFNLLLGGFSQYKINDVLSILVQYHFDYGATESDANQQSVSCGLMITF